MLCLHWFADGKVRHKWSKQLPDGLIESTNANVNYKTLTLAENQVNGSVKKRGKFVIDNVYSNTALELRQVMEAKEKKKTSNRTNHKWSMKALRSERLSIGTVHANSIQKIEQPVLDIGLCASTESHVCHRQRVLFVLLSLHLLLILRFFFLFCWNSKNERRQNAFSVAAAPAAVEAKAEHSSDSIISIESIGFEHMCMIPFTFYSLVSSHFCLFDIFFSRFSLSLFISSAWHLNFFG